MRVSNSSAGNAGVSAGQSSSGAATSSASLLNSASKLGSLASAGSKVSDFVISNRPSASNADLLNSSQSDSTDASSADSASSANSSASLTKQMIAMMEQMLSMMQKMTSDIGNGNSSSSSSSDIGTSDDTASTTTTDTGSASADTATSGSSTATGGSADSSSQSMSFDEVVSTLDKNKDLMGSKNSREDLENLRDSADTPADMKKALTTLLDNPDMYARVDEAGDKKGKADGTISKNDLKHLMNSTEMQNFQNGVSTPTSSDPNSMSYEDVVSTLGRNEGLMKGKNSREDLEKLRDDENTPDDMKQALDTVLKDPSIYARLDEAGDKNGKADGTISLNDIQHLQNSTEMKAYQNQQAETYTDNYVPSDAAPGSAAREMTANDASRELYRYSQDLPKNIDLDTLQKIADGSQDMKKCPPQLAAAAKYYTDHPDEWKKMVGNDSGKVSTDKMCDQVASSIQLSPQESKALQTLNDNKDIFFKDGGINQDKLTKIANDTSNSQDVRDAANLLSQPNSVLFTMLDNGKHGAGGDFFNKANDKNISKGDLSAFLKNGSGEVAQPDTLSGPATNEADAKAQNDMAMGQQTQPDEKKEKGGGFYKMLDILGNVLTGLLTAIPGIGEAALAARAAAAVGEVAAKEATQAGIKAGAEEAAKQTAKQVAKEGLKEGAKAGWDQVTGGDDQVISTQVNENTDQAPVYAQS